MKRKLIGILSACILLSGCRAGSTPPEQTMTTAPETTQPTTISINLLEQGTVMDESPNLLYIPNEAVESMNGPKLYPMGTSLLLSEYRNRKLTLNCISLEDGSLKASASFASGNGTKIVVDGSRVGLCDMERGSIKILDRDLQELQSYEVSVGDDWYLNSKLDTLYVVFYDRGLMAMDLETGRETWLIDNGFQVTTMSCNEGHLIVEYTDRMDQKTYWRCLDLDMASLDELPMGTGEAWITHQGDDWLLRDGDDYVLIQGQERRSYSWEDSTVRMLGQQHLLAMDASNRELTVFDLDGTFRSRCVLPMTGSNGFVGDDFVWCDPLEGYFFTDFTGDKFRLMFWDVSADMDGEDLPAATMEQPPEPVLEPALYERAQEISERYGVEVLIGEQCELIYSEYETYVLAETAYVSGVLDLLDEALSRYPDGFLDQLCYGTVQTIRFQVVGALFAKEGVTDYSNYVNAFAQHRDHYYAIVLDGFSVTESTIYHELSHVIDKKLAWDAGIRPDALFSEERWMALQPEGFRFAESYVDMPQEVLDYQDSGYFIRKYSMTFPTEDRAVLMAAAMDRQYESFGPGSGTLTKMQFYADCIRDCFHTEGWPETAAWEEVLK